MSLCQPVPPLAILGVSLGGSLSFGKTRTGPLNEKARILQQPSPAFQLAIGAAGELRFEGQSAANTGRRQGSGGGGGLRREADASCFSLLVP